MPSSSSREEISLVLNSLYNREVFGLEQERKNLLTLIQATLNRGESNSALVVGPRGSGKSALIQAVLEELDLLGNENDKSKEVAIIRLNGLLQTRDSLALKEIACQMKLVEHTENKVFGSFAEHLEFLLKSLKSENVKKPKPILFIVEEFDLFCGHHNQTLLYNLFDTAMNKGAAILVIGVTTNMDVQDLLEKRVLSRFGKRLIYVWEMTKFEDYLNLVRHFLIHPDSKKSWIKCVDSFLNEEETKAFFEKVFNQNPSIPFMQNLIMKSLLDMFEDTASNFELIYFEQTLLELNPDLVKEPIMGLTSLELTMAISCMHWQLLHSDSPINFATAYQDYHKFVSKNCSILSSDRSVAMKCWEKLIYLEIIRSHDRTLKAENEFRFYNLNVLPEEIKRTVNERKDVPTCLRDWVNGMNL